MEPISSNTTAPLASADSQTTSPLLGSSNRMVTPLSGTCSSITAPLFGSSSSITTDLPGSGTTTSTAASRFGTGARTTASLSLWLQQQRLGSSLGLGRQKQRDSPALRWYWRQYGDPEVTAHDVRDAQINLDHFTPSDFDDFLLEKRKSVSVGMLSGYRSAIKDLYRKKERSLPLAYNSKLTRLFSGLKRMEASKFQSGSPKESRKNPLPFSLYCELCRATLARQDAGFAHLFLSTL
ncbi:hypothetical protein F444_09988 [Phytophthora nicotianae P1976]|uniref:Core-binding (CB) domain-containing protein n=1 Tax=Phytophthora nicotianae P1976 TaxID=1317066 RepID=A0A081A5Q2_PHYNI|nr:hypothetical protein F444_09988 [Phytophthora nicotianae P1976]